MNKLQMAHDYAKILLEKGGIPKPHESQQVIDYVAQLSAGLANAVIFECGVDINEVEWQPDWSIAPEWAEYWCQDSDKTAYWYELEPKIINDYEWWIDDGEYTGAPRLNYKGHWTDSLRKRPK